MAFDNKHGRCYRGIHDLVCGGDLMMYLYLRRFFIRKVRSRAGWRATLSSNSGSSILSHPARLAAPEES